MKVKAIKVGFFGKYRRPGDEFNIDNDNQFSTTWMVKLEAPKVEQKKSNKKKTSK